FWENEEAWQRYRFHSPITYVADMDTPLLLIQAENDYRCPIVEGEQLLTALRVRRQTVELIRMPGPSHVIVISGAPHQRYFQWSLAKDWFDKYAMGLAEPEEAAAAVATPEVVTPPLSPA
ncbi:MAG: prolyl oligopeptidase family serine peptidase, partial [Chloroflexota bacterium]|nr:prolyl oligopeptidase family serine peptidase [Chloroflexota bacterium]